MVSYTCQLFLRYKREIFILGVLGFLKMTRSFPKIPEEVRSLPKTSEVCRRRSYRENAYPQGPTLVDNISAIVLKSESFGLTWSIFHGFRSLHGSESTYFWKLCQVFSFRDFLPSFHWYALNPTYSDSFT